MTFDMKQALQIWGGLECTCNRVGDEYFDQAARSGHEQRGDDPARIAALGITRLRFPILWEKTAPGSLHDADWSWPDRQLPALREAGVEVIAGLVHHGSGPAHTSLLDADFGDKLAAYAGAVAARYPWIDAWTPVNEPLTTARFSGLYGLWYPHARTDAAFVTALLNQCRGIVLSMAAIRAVNPRARLVQTDDLGKTWGTSTMAATIKFYNERRWLGWDLLCGRVDQQHRLWRYLMKSGAKPADVLWFAEHPCPPDIIGVNYYVTSERWLDHRLERFPQHTSGVIAGRPCIDIEAARAMPRPIGGAAPLLLEAWQRYGLPLAVTEAHIDAGREDQLRWFMEVWRAAGDARAAGADVRAVTAWSLFGAFDWNSLVTRSVGYYESGVFDIRGGAPRPTALAALLRQLARGEQVTHPAAQGPGWWRRDVRLAGVSARRRPNPQPSLHDPLPPQALQLLRNRVPEPPLPVAPILISGASGTLGRAFARICAQRHLPFVLLARADMDITDAGSVERALERFQPWAVINASGYVRVDAAEHDAERCFRENTIGPAVLAAACARHGVHLTTFSSDMVFDGRRDDAYLEDDDVSPINVYGRSKAEGENAVLGRLPGALVVRTSSFFGPWDRYNFVTQALDALEQGRRFTAPHDIVMSPTYVPDLVDTCLNLIIDGESGLWHLTNGDAVSWIDLARRAASTAELDPAALVANHSSECSHVAARPLNSTLQSSRGILMPNLQHAMDRFVAQRGEAPAW
ncbi:MAG: dTDP-4-dehydrorhamnose reductase [Massilia sp.]|nr:dTDP-4-dehydrorhamnose reductase [Massilia sp.]